MQEKISKLIMVVGLLFATLYQHNNYWRSIWLDKWFWVMFFAVVLLAFKVCVKYNPIIGTFFGYVLLSALWATGWRQAYPNADMMMLLGIERVAGYAYLCFITFAFVCLSLKPFEYNFLLKLFGIITMINSVKIIGQFFAGWSAFSRGGVFGNPSMSGCFIAMTMPILVKSLWPHKFLRWLLIVPLFAIYLTDSSQPVGVLVLTLSAMAYSSNNIKLKRHTGWVLIGLSVIGLIALFTTSDYNNGIFASSGRTKLWTMIFTWWAPNGHLFTGQGTGTSQVILPILQKLELLKVPNGPANADWWLWFHSDWLQLLFENGLIGFVLGVLVFVELVISSFAKSQILFSCLIGFAACALFNFPVHFPMHAFFGMSIVAMIIDKKYLRRYEV